MSEQVTNYHERKTAAYKGLVLAAGGTLPTRDPVSNPVEYRLQLLEAAAVGTVGGATFTIGAENTNVKNVAIQLTDGLGNNLAHAACVQIYLAADSAGQVIGSGVGTPAGLAIGTNGLYRQLTANISGFCTSEANGLIDLNITNTGTGSQYLVVVLPNGKLVVSGAITFA